MLRFWLRFWLTLPLLLPALPAVAQTPAVAIREVRRETSAIAIYAQYSQLFDAPTRKALEAGLPVTLALRWSLWRVDREESRVAAGGLWYRVVYDVLDGRYALFDNRGRLLDSRATPEQLQRFLETHPVLQFSRSPDATPRLHPQQRYRLDLELRLQPLATGQIGELERWLRGAPETRDEHSSSLGISRFVVGWMKHTVGLGERSLRARSEPFSG